MKCTNCNNEIKENEKFCTNCGTEVKVSNEKKKGNVGLVIGIILGVLIFIILIVVIGILLSRPKTNNVSNSQNNTTNNSNNTSSGTIEDNKSNNTASGKVEDSYTIIGNDEVGYMKAPGKFVDFVDVDGTDTVQYTNGVEIVSMYALKSEHTAKEYADGAYSNALDDEDQEDVTGATVKVGKYTAYQVYSYFEDDEVWLVRWYFDTEDGYYRYIAIEGPTYSDVFEMVDTFSLTKLN